jgi:hypothetical protein
MGGPKTVRTALPPIWRLSDEQWASNEGQSNVERHKHTRNQHAATSGWPESCRIDTTGLTVEESSS